MFMRMQVASAKIQDTPTSVNTGQLRIIFQIDLDLFARLSYVDLGIFVFNLWITILDIFAKFNATNRKCKGEFINTLLYNRF